MVRSLDRHLVDAMERQLSAVPGLDLSRPDRSYLLVRPAGAEDVIGEVLGAASALEADVIDGVLSGVGWVNAEAVARYSVGRALRRSTPEG